MASKVADSQGLFLERFTQRWHTELLPSLEDRLEARLDSLTRTLKEELKATLNDLRPAANEHTSRRSRCPSAAWRPSGDLAPSLTTSLRASYANLAPSLTASRRASEPKVVMLADDFGDARADLPTSKSLHANNYDDDDRAIEQQIRYMTSRAASTPGEPDMAISGVIAYLAAQLQDASEPEWDQSIDVWSSRRKPAVDASKHTSLQKMQQGARWFVDRAESITDLLPVIRSWSLWRVLFDMTVVVVTIINVFRRVACRQICA